MADRTLQLHPSCFPMAGLDLWAPAFLAWRKHGGWNEWVGPGEGPIVPERAGALIDFINGRPFCMERKDVKSW